ncbi:MAG TPA: TlpA family protein disulfide reductase [bacterium]|nr:TlpA family protein disulfide reductase [bacterium]
MQNEKDNTLIIVLVVIGLIAAGVGAYLIFFQNTDSAPTDNSAKEEGPLDLTGDLGQLVFKDADGNDAKLADYMDGKTLIIANSWATWCPFCLQELLDFVDLQKKYGDELVIITINRAETLAQANSYLEDVGVAGELIHLQDSKDSFYKGINGIAMPETLFFDKDGKMVKQQRGVMSLEKMETNLELAR